MGLRSDVSSENCSLHPGVPNRPVVTSDGGGQPHRPVSRRKWGSVDLRAPR